MALNYYIDPATRRRTTRDALVHRRDLAVRRVAKWAAVYEDATDRFDRARTKRTQEKYRVLANRAARYGARADRDVDAAHEAIEEGDGRRPYRYRWSVSYQQGTKLKNRLQVDVLLHKIEYERASEAEVKRALGELLRTKGTPPDGWTVEYVTWYHGPEQYEVKDRDADLSLDASFQKATGEHVWDVGLFPFKTVIGEQRNTAAEVVGEEELDRSAIHSVVQKKATKAKGRGRPKRKGV